MSYLLLLLLSAVFFCSFKVIKSTSFANTSLSYVLAAPIGISVSCYALYLSLITRQNVAVVLLEALLILGFYLYCFGKRSSDDVAVSGPLRHVRLILLLMAVLILCVRINSKFLRWGEWDAWAIWTLHAKFLYQVEYWQNMFDTALRGSHPDYPLMLPSLVALLWKSVGGISALVPIAVAHGVFLLLIGTICFAITRYGSVVAAVFCFIILASDNKFVQIASSQYADTLLGYFLLVAFILRTEITENTSGRTALILGLLAGSLAWIKNEGILFFAVFSFVFLIDQYKRKNVNADYLIGALLPVAVLLHFKLTLAPANDLINDERGADLISMVFDGHRYFLILRSFVQVSIQYYWVLFVVAAILVFRKEFFFRSFSFIVIGLIIAGYFAIYLTTPNDLQWHLDASLDRVFHQIFPSCLFLLLVKLRPSFSVWKGLGWRWS